MAVPMKKLQAIRKQRNMTLKQFADLLGLSEGLISYYENGIKNPSYKRLLEIKNKLNVEYEDLID